MALKKVLRPIQKARKALAGLDEFSRYYLLRCQEEEPEALLKHKLELAEEIGFIKDAEQVLKDAEYSEAERYWETIPLLEVAKMHEAGTLPNHIKFEEDLAAFENQLIEAIEKTPDRPSGRPKESFLKYYVQTMGVIFALLTGKKPTLAHDTMTGEPTGAFFTFLDECFKEMGRPMNAEALYKLIRTSIPLKDFPTLTGYMDRARSLLGIR
jgi:hypothetical protein